VHLWHDLLLEVEVDDVHGWFDVLIQVKVEVVVETEVPTSVTVHVSVEVTVFVAVTVYVCVMVLGATAGQVDVEDAGGGLAASPQQLALRVMPKHLVCSKFGWT
jgi:hypothetical protein